MDEKAKRKRQNDDEDDHDIVEAINASRYQQSNTNDDDEGSINGSQNVQSKPNIIDKAIDASRYQQSNDKRIKRNYERRKNLVEAIDGSRKSLRVRKQTKKLMRCFCILEYMIYPSIRSMTSVQKNIN